MFLTLSQVALGGALGATMRYLTNVGVMRTLGPGFPFSTMIVNVAGSFLMGFLVVLMAKKGGNAFAPFVLTGLLGGFTTFSAFSLDALTLWERGEAPLAFAYVAGSVFLSLAAIAAGLFVARTLI
ncbi:fluoride efflux transporter CrcB [Thioclava sp. FR2]|uniref:fluoride efflux transporter CrcB n=1 Tax=Thioclava sp. FR2 TaxID=3445780 RepID=UPI003EC12741